MTGQRGFTLLEMLAALALLAIGTSVVMGAFGYSTRALHQVTQRDRLYLAAWSILDDADSQPPQVGTAVGEWDGLHWVRRTAPAAGTHGPARLLQVELDVSDGAHSITLNTLRVVWAP